MIYILNFVAILLLSTNSQAFPQLFLQNTERCIKCHSSEIGVGLLSQEGRLFSINNSAENKSTDYQLPLPNWLRLGLKTQHRQYFYQSDYVKEATFKDLTTEILSEIKLNDTLLIASIDRYTPNQANITFKDYVYISNLYAEYEIDTYFKIKFGKYFLNYGIDQFRQSQFKNSILFSKIQKGFEKNQAEIFYIQNNFDVAVAYIFNRTEFNQIYSEKGVLFNLKYIFDSQFLIGVASYTSEQSNVLAANESQKILGLFGIYKYDSDINFYFQVDQNINSSNKKGISAFIEPQITLKQGHMVLAKVEYLNYDIELSEPKFSELVVGYRYTPWAQFNILAQIKKTNNSIDSIYLNNQNSESLAIDFNLTL